MAFNYKFKKIDTNENIPYSTRNIDVIEMIPTLVKKNIWNVENKRISIEALKNIGLEVVMMPVPTREEIDYQKFTSMYSANPNLISSVTKYKNLLDTLPTLSKEHKFTIATTKNSSMIKCLSATPFMFQGNVITHPKFEPDTVFAGVVYINGYKYISLNNNVTTTNSELEVSVNIINYSSSSDTIIEAVKVLPDLSEIEKLELGQVINTTFHDIVVNGQAIASYLDIKLDDYTLWSELEKLVYYLPQNNIPAPPVRDSIIPLSTEDEQLALLQDRTLS
jgi:predicted nucleic-acid-binding protein